MKSGTESQMPKQVCWMKPWPGEVKVNTNGSRVGDPPVAGFGGLLRYYLGVWLKGYSSRLGDDSALYAELHSIKHGLIMAWTMGFRMFGVRVTHSILFS